MRKRIARYILLLIVLAVTAAWNGDITLPFTSPFVSTAEAVIGRPATPVSYAGVARRTPVGVGVNTPANRGGPVNRVGRR